MKHRLLCALLALLLFAGCTPTDPTMQDNAQQPNAPAVVTEFAEHGLEFSVPKNWSTSGFEVEFDEVKNGNSGYDTRTFYAMIDGIRTPIMMISRFSKENWDALVESDPSAESVKLGTSQDGNFVYTYLVKDDIVPESNAGKKALEAIRKEAEKLKDAIKITE